MLKFMAAPLPKWLHGLVTLTMGAAWIILISLFIKWFPRTIPDIIANLLLFGCIIVVSFAITMTFRTPYFQSTNKLLNLKPKIDAPASTIVPYLLFFVLFSTVPMTVIFPTSLSSSAASLIISGLSPLGSTTLIYRVNLLPKWLYRIITLMLGAVWVALIFTFIKWFPRTLADILFNLMPFVYSIYVVWIIVKMLRLSFDANRRQNTKWKVNLSPSKIALWILFLALLSTIPIAILWSNSISLVTASIIVAGLTMTGQIIMQFDKSKGEEK